MTTRQRVATLAPIAPAAIALGVLFGGGMVGAVEESLQTERGAQSGGSAWSTLLTDPVFRDALWFTARTTLVSTAASAAVAVLAAIALRRRGTTVRSLFTLPVSVPHLLVATVAVIWLAPGGLADRLLHGLPVLLVRDDEGIGIVLVYVYKEAPFLTLLLLGTMDVRLVEREEAAATHGATPVQRMRWVVWPAVRAPLAAGSLVVAAFTFGAFEVPLVLGPNYPPTVATYALLATREDIVRGQPTAAAALLVAAAVSFVIALAALGVGGRGE